ncbi:hypothetical protein LCGC14_0598600 [marine sediment metagenome]|uniref:Uncharacterized protein n=1 Tax=marine sediment metagenome TaxID=412755 RepID=A0A0F9RG87_9ZZZZ
MAELKLAGTGEVQPAGTDGIAGYLEVPGLPQLEVMRVESSLNGDFVFSRRFQKIKSVHAQNHGTNIGTGVRADNPKITITQGGTNSNAKITINHTATQEVFSLFIWGDV